ncbi:hypothetical protein CHUAL_000363 [Chamberlinius hualienensis]
MKFNQRTVVGLTILLIAVAVHSVSAIRCYQCNSITDAGCDLLPVNNKYIKDCSELKDGSRYDRCRKIEQWVDIEVEGQKPIHRIARTCGMPQGDDERDCYYRAGFGGRQQVCSCQEPECNAATKLNSINIFAISLFSTIALCLYKYIQ